MSGREVLVCMYRILDRPRTTQSRRKHLVLLYLPSRSIVSRWPNATCPATIPPMSLLEHLLGLSKYCDECSVVVK